VISRRLAHSVVSACSQQSLYTMNCGRVRDYGFTCDNGGGHALAALSPDGLPLRIDKGAPSGAVLIRRALPAYRCAPGGDYPDMHRRHNRSPINEGQYSALCFAAAPVHAA
jgi:hypothetical protein